MILAELDQKIQAFLEIQICQNLAITRHFDLDLDQIYHIILTPKLNFIFV